MPRKIILLSDGTGNSSISRDKSNIWRLYKALDLSTGTGGDHDQLVFYDDGVGTSGFRPLKLLGGAFGFGLSRNVRDLYAALCRHYQPGDQIYIMGFSRGAFTARILAHFIEICGILDVTRTIPVWPQQLLKTPAKGALPLTTERGFNRAVTKAYKSYRRSYWQRNTHTLPKILSTVGSFIRNKILRSDVIDADKFKQAFSHAVDNAQSDSPVIEFVGVFDTVDALGLPIDEFTDVVDKYFYPYKFKNQKLGRDVRCAVQALSIDDERHSFHPLLWDQSNSEDQARIQQVWFSGMHSGVGGGYPEDNLALIPLNWMISHLTGGPLKVAPLKFVAETLIQYEKQAQPTGKMYNSRRGVSVFYRYRPRNISRLCRDDDPKNPVYTGPTILHQSVLERIGQTNSGYAPAGIPSDFQICLNDGEVVTPEEGDRFYEAAPAVLARSSLLSQSEDLIAWGRVAYFAMLAVMLLIVVFPFYLPGIPGWKAHFETYAVLNDVLRGVSYLISKTSALLPDIWVNAFRQHPLELLGLLAVFWAFYGWGWRLRQNIQKLGEAGWAHWKGRNIVHDKKSRPRLSQIANAVRTKRQFRRTKGVVSTQLVPFMFFVILGWLAITALVQTRILPGVANISPCERLNARDLGQTLERDTSKSISFHIKMPCFATGFDIEAGRSYEIEILNPANGRLSWSDASYKADHKGLGKIWNTFEFPFVAALPLKRHLTLPWFALVGEIGKNSGHIIPFNESKFEFEAQKSGQLYLYVNDAIQNIEIPGDYEKLDALKNWKYFYDNNIGEAKISIKRVK